jgi:hypothetical protein
MLMYWLTLGIPLSWKKGSIHDLASGCGPYTWIGVEYSLARPGLAKMAVPAAFVKAVLDDLEGLLVEKAVAAHIAERLVGRVGRIAQIVPSARPFAGAMYAALTASKQRVKQGRLEAPPGKVASCRFVTAARWFSTLLRDPLYSTVLIERLVSQHGEPEVSLQDASLEFDASPWGGGASCASRGFPRSTSSSAGPALPPVTLVS